MNAMSLLDQAVSSAARLCLEDVPSAALIRAGCIIADTVGVSCAGSRQKEMVKLFELDQSLGMISDSYRGGSTLVGRPGLRALPEHAAFLNSTAGSFVELDEGMRPTGHPGMQVVIPAIAQAEAQGAHGSALLRAVIAGYEVTSRLFTAYSLSYPVHPHGHFGAVGGAVAVALLTEQDPVQAARIAATSPILSVWDACFEGATARNTWMGSAAALAIRSSRLAQAGFTGTSSGLETTFGKIAGRQVNRQALVAPLDYDNLGLNRNYFKLHSACALSHAAVDAVLNLPHVDPEDIERITVETVKNNMKLNHPALPNALSARFSLPYVVAAAALRRGLGADTFEFEPETARLAERVHVQVANDLEAKWPAASPARITMMTASGTFNAQVDNPHGHYSDPLNEEEVRSKFFDLVANDVFAKPWWDRLTDLIHVENCANLFTGMDGRAH